MRYLINIFAILFFLESTLSCGFTNSSTSRNSNLLIKDCISMDSTYTVKGTIYLWDYIEDSVKVSFNENRPIFSDLISYNVDGHGLPLLSFYEKNNSLVVNSCETNQLISNPFIMEVSIGESRSKFKCNLDTIQTIILAKFDLSKEVGIETFNEFVPF